MTTKSGPVGIIAWLLIACGIAGCDRTAGPDPDVLPEVEPTTADQTDRVVAERFQRETASGITDRAANEWPQLFGPARTSSLPGARLNLTWSVEGPPELWSIDVGTGYGSPVVSRNRVIFNHRIGDEEIIQCVDALSGQSVWLHRYPTTFECEFEYSNGPLSTPVIDGDHVYAAGGQGQFLCLDFHTGRVLWSRNLQQEYGLTDDIFAMGSSPLVVGDRLVFNVGAKEAEAGVIAMDRGTGETIWEATNHGAAYCSPFAATVHGEPFVFVVTFVGLVSIHPQTGAVDWVIEHRCRAPMSFNAVSPLVDGDKVLAVTGPGPGAVCVRVLPDRGYEELWQSRRVIDSQYNTLMLADGMVYGFTSAGQGGAELRCVEFATGRLRWKYHSILRRGQGLLAGDGIIALGERGHLAAILRTGDEPKVLAFTEEPLMEEPCYCSPALSGTRLYLKDETRLACFDLSLPQN